MPSGSPELNLLNTTNNNNIADPNNIVSGWNAGTHLDAEGVEVPNEVCTAEKYPDVTVDAHTECREV